MQVGLSHLVGDTEIQPMGGQSTVRLAIHDDGGELVSQLMLIKKLANLSHLPSMIVPSVMRYRGRDVRHAREFSFITFNRLSKSLRDLGQTPC